MRRSIATPCGATFLPRSAAGRLRQSILPVRRLANWTSAIVSVRVESSRSRPEALMATWITDRAGLAGFAGDTPAVTDDHPRIEYATWVRPREFGRVFARLLQFRSDPPLQGADAAFSVVLAAEREQLDGFYNAGLSVYVGDRAQYARDMARVMRDAASNPYYAWFVGPQRR